MSMRFFLLHPASALALPLLFTSTLAAAQDAPPAAPPAAPATPPAGAQAAVAEALFQQGRDLLKQERYAEACPKIAESQRLDPKLGTLLNLAFCYEKIDKIATAWAAYTSAASIARSDGKKEREDFAREQVALLEKRLMRVTLKVQSPVPSLVVRWDDQAMTGAALDTPFPVDPGKHLLSAVAPGKKEWSMSVDIPVDRAETIPLSIPALEALPKPPPAAIEPPKVTPPPSSTPRPTTPPEPPPANTLRLVSYASFGVGGAGLLLGVIAGGVTLSQAGTIRDACPKDKCSADQQGPIDAATTTANLANAGFVIAAIGAGTGAVSYFLSRPKADAAHPSARVDPIVGPGFLGLRGSF